ncbi:hypothetical protein LWI28_004239 [Acer negundo]|uniref:Uncharacterized protein n=1 Tax=Acer negundo TaxID=4023 RepID=A0AAD5J3Z7_ACENE|nr:hypothetical protein LWI28_004239 [Acer negundo]
MNQLNDANMDAYNWVMKIDAKHWSRHAFDEHVKSDHVTNNITENFNGWIDKFRELKKRIDKYFEGDKEAIPSIFEAILCRKLSRKHEQSDNELLEEIRHKTDHHQDLEINSEED